jgi:hypothetical protein
MTIMQIKHFHVGLSINDVMFLREESQETVTCQKNFGLSNKHNRRRRSQK